MNLTKRIFLIFCCSLLIALPTVTVNAANTQLPNGEWRVYVSNKPVVPVAQQTPVWCWAASLSALFGYYGHPVNQIRIVQRYHPYPVISTASPMLMFSALNSQWVDDNGKTFQFQSAVTDLYTPNGPRQVNNLNLLDALNKDIPVFYADSTHAMIMVQVDYRVDHTPQGDVPVILRGWAIDPMPKLYPCPPVGQLCPGPNPEAIGFRQLQNNEMVATFVGIPANQ